MGTWGEEGQGKGQGELRLPGAQVGWECRGRPLIWLGPGPFTVTNGPQFSSLLNGEIKCSVS